MSLIRVRNLDGTTIELRQYSIECPFCHAQIIPNFLFWDGYKLFVSCPNNTCNRHFVLTQNKEGKYIKVEPNAIPFNKDFSDIIISISSQFAEIYNQAYHAEQMGLDQICGVGYRKALEFLIKDYLLSKETDEQIKDNIKKKLLGNCIQENVQNNNIKNVAKRAVWLGNDETHYVRVWEDKDVQYLKKLIELTIRWIENEIETEHVLQEMSK